MNRTSVCHSLLERTILELRSDADTFVCEAEKKSALTDIITMISKSNALKRAANEKQEELYNIVAKKKMLMQKKSDL